MDNILIIIAVVAFFIFQTYSNYKKEQEEAKTRNPSSRRPSTSESPQKEVPPAMEIPRWLEDFLPPQETMVQKTEKSYEKPEPVAMSTNDHHGSIKYQPVKYIPSELPPDLLKEYRNLPEKLEMEQLKRSVAIQKSQSYKFKKMTPQLLADEVEQVIDVPEFSLRDAIIMNAILERPYK